MSKSPATLPIEKVERVIVLMRGEKVILDSELARLYGVSTARLNQQVNRNSERFPSDFMFRLTEEEFKDLILQNATSKKSQGGRRKLPYAFTEHGAIMAANVLSSPGAVQASVQVLRAFIQLRRLLYSNAELARKLDDLEGKYDRQFRIVFDAIRELMIPPAGKPKAIGFRASTHKK